MVYDLFSHWKDPYCQSVSTITTSSAGPDASPQSACPHPFSSRTAPGRGGSQRRRSGARVASGGWGRRGRGDEWSREGRRRWAWLGVVEEEEWNEECWWASMMTRTLKKMNSPPDTLNGFVQFKSMSLARLQAFFWKYLHHENALSLISKYLKKSAMENYCDGEVKPPMEKIAYF